MNIDERKQRGSELLVQMLGSEQAAAMRKVWQDVSPELEGYIVEFVAGEMWSRPGLDLRTRSLATVAALTALGRSRALELNVRLALNNGASRQEIIETMLQMAPYAGFPAAWEGLTIAHKVFHEAK